METATTALTSFPGELGAPVPAPPDEGSGPMGAMTMPSNSARSGGRSRLRPIGERDPGAAPHAGRERRPHRTAVVSRATNEAFAMIERLAPTNVTVTLIGETGTGKDVFAHLVHDSSPRA